MRTDAVLVALLFGTTQLACVGQRWPAVPPDAAVADGGAVVRPLTQALALQAAFNDSTFFLHARWTSEAVAPALTVMLSGRTPATAVRGFANEGCFLACHDTSDEMPNWLPADGDRTMYLLPGFGGPAEIWRWQAGAGAPTGQVVHGTLGTNGMVDDPDGGAGGLAAAGSPAGPDWDVLYTRTLAAPGPGVTALVPGASYDLGLALHAEDAQGRHHHVSLPISVGLGDSSATLRAGPLPGASTPDFSDSASFPPIVVELFLPGLTSFEFLVGAAVDRSGRLRNNDVRHGGALAVATATHPCSDCHRVVSDDVVSPVQNAGALERLVLRRGGVVGPARVEVTP